MLTRGQVLAQGHAISERELTEAEQSRNEFEARRQLYVAGKAVVIPLDHPAVKGGFKAIVEGFAETEYGPRRKQQGSRA